jgi:hypothetical protein
MGTVSREGMVLPDKVSFHVMAIGRTWYQVNQENREHRLESHSITWFGISSPKLTYQHVASVEQNQTKSPKQTIATPHTKRTEPPIDQRRATPRTRTAWPGSRRTRGEGSATGARYRNTAGPARGMGPCALFIRYVCRANRQAGRIHDASRSHPVRHLSLSTVLGCRGPPRRFFRPPLSPIHWSPRLPCRCSLPQTHVGRTATASVQCSACVQLAELPGSSCVRLSSSTQPVASSLRP